MIIRYFELHSPRCDFCGHMLGAEKDDAAAEAAMLRDGWEKRNGKDACPVCLIREKETGRLPERRRFLRNNERSHKTMDEKNMIEQAEAEAEAEAARDSTTLLSDAVHCIAAQRERIEDAEGRVYHSAFESYSVLLKALVDKNAAEKDLKKSLESLWDGVKKEDDAVIIAFLQEISRVARESAMGWIRVAAIADKAGASV